MTSPAGDARTWSTIYERQREEDHWRRREEETEATRRDYSAVVVSAEELSEADELAFCRWAEAHPEWPTREGWRAWLASATRETDEHILRQHAAVRRSRIERLASDAARHCFVWARRDLPLVCSAYQADDMRPYAAVGPEYRGWK